MVSELTFARVLLVDSSPTDRALHTVFLQQAGVRHVVEAGDATQAFNVIIRAQQPFDAVIADIKLSDLSGFRLLQVVRTNEARPMRPDSCFILMSGDWDSAALTLARQLDVSGVLLKPFEPAKLKQQLAAARRRVFAINIPRYLAVITP
ncbi:MAG: response regulator [Rhodospirillaceae bacterium]